MNRGLGCLVSRELGITVLVPVRLVFVYPAVRQDGTQIMVLDGNMVQGYCFSTHHSCYEVLRFTGDCAQVVRLRPGKELTLAGQGLYDVGAIIKVFLDSLDIDALGVLDSILQYKPIAYPHAAACLELTIFFCILVQQSHYISRLVRVESGVLEEVFPSLHELRTTVGEDSLEHGGVYLSGKDDAFKALVIKRVIE